jgi:Rps23 Pro-64 3,4-dihydroxylase Tpa1-like proline 4-hydroxylase
MMGLNMREQSRANKDFFFLETQSFNDAFQELKDRKVRHLRWGWVVSTIFTLAITLITAQNFNSVFGISAKNIKVIIQVAICIFSGWLLFIIIRNIINKFRNKYSVPDLKMVQKTLLEKSNDLNKYTVLLFVPDFNCERLTFLAKKHTKWQNAIFLPYINYSNKKDFDQLIDIEKKTMDLFKTDIKINCEYLNDMDIYNEIKFHKDEQQLYKYNYKFVLVYPKSNFLSKVFFNNCKHDHDFEYYAIDKMQNDLQTMMRNNEIVGMLRENERSLNSRLSSLQLKTNRLLWNISEQCEKGCEYCAFGESPNDVTLKIDIEKIIAKLEALKIDIIDISTGDIVEIEYLKKSIIALSDKGYKINLTATSIVIELLGNDFIQEHISTIEFTFDSTEKKDDRASSNFECIKKMSKYFKKKDIVKFRALVILYKNLTLKMLQNVEKKLIGIGVRDITLIRLMPVGIMTKEKYPPELSKKEHYNDIIEYCKKSQNIITHCSFDGISCGKNYCNKGINKMSMSPSGDLYSCPWSEHLPYASRNYKIGNVVNDNVIDKINQQDWSHFMNEKFTCNIFNNVFDEDFLYK